MDCDGCKCLLTEDNTYERVLCLPCKGIEEKTHCFKCRSSSFVWGRLDWLIAKTSHHSYQIGYAWAFLCLYFVLYLFAHSIAREFLFGACLIVFIILALFSIVFIPYWSAVCTSALFDEDAFKDSRNLDPHTKILVWVLGLLGYGILFLVWVAGHGIYKSMYH